MNANNIISLPTDSKNNKRSSVANISNDEVIGNNKKTKYFVTVNYINSDISLPYRIHDKYNNNIVINDTITSSLSQYYTTIDKIDSNSNHTIIKHDTDFCFSNVLASDINSDIYLPSRSNNQYHEECNNNND